MHSPATSSCGGPELGRSTFVPRREVERSVPSEVISSRCGLFDWGGSSSWRVGVCSNGARLCRRWISSSFWQHSISWLLLVGSERPGLERLHHFVIVLVVSGSAVSRRLLNCAATNSNRLLNDREWPFHERIRGR